MTDSGTVLDEFRGGAGGAALLGGARSRADPLAGARVRLAVLAGWTGLCYAAWIGGGAVTAPLPRWQERWRRWIFRSWARGTALTLGLRSRGEGPRPQAPSFLVANHLSYVDVVVLAAELGPVFVAKSEVEDWPVLGVLARSIGTIFVDRRVKRDSLRALDRIDRAIAAGRSVVLFAEGTSSRGAEVGPMKPALLEWAARRRYPVRYASLSYRTETGDPPADLAVCWWGDMTFLDHLAGLCRLNRFHATVRFGEEALEDDDRTRLAERLRYAVAQQFTPVVKSTPN